MLLLDTNNTIKITEKRQNQNNNNKQVCHFLKHIGKEKLQSCKWDPYNHKLQWNKEELRYDPNDCKKFTKTQTESINYQTKETEEKE